MKNNAFYKKELSDTITIRLWPTRVYMHILPILVMSLVGFVYMTGLTQYIEQAEQTRAHDREQIQYRFDFPIND